MKYSIDFEHLTVLVIDGHGESCDLNAGGEVCETAGDLVSLIVALWEQGAYDVDERDALLRDVAFGERIGGER